jgi:hypothetical protein
MNAKIRAEAPDYSQPSQIFDTLTIDIGSRLTASPAFKRAVRFCARPDELTGTRQRVKPEDIQQSAVVMASFAWHAAMKDDQ